MQIEHDPWLAKNSEGICNQKIAIVGYSHYVDGPDCPSVTNDVVRSVVEGKQKYQFFTKIQSYFGFADSTMFWNRVVFFNFLPDSIGTREYKHAVGTAQQLERGRSRFLQIIAAEKPDKVFAFTSKGWRAFPETTLEELSNRSCTPLIEGQREPNWGTYMVGDHRVLVCGFRHPQYAANIDMTAQVQAFLNMAPPS